MTAQLIPPNWSGLKTIKTLVSTHPQDVKNRMTQVIITWDICFISSARWVIKLLGPRPYNSLIHPTNKLVVWVFTPIRTEMVTMMSQDFPLTTMGVIVDGLALEVADHQVTSNQTSVPLVALWLFQPILGCTLDKPHPSTL